MKSEADTLRKAVRELELLVSEADMNRRLRSELDPVNFNAGRLILLLDAEQPNAPIQLLEPELTVRVKGNGRDDFLWENRQRFELALLPRLTKPVSLCAL